MKKALPILLSIILILGLLTPVFVYGTVAEGEGKATLLQEGATDIMPAPAPRRSLLKSSGYEAAENYMYEQLMAMSSSINLSSYNIPVEDFSAIYGNFINQHPDLFFVSGAFNYNYYPSTGNVAYLTPQYTMTAAEKEEALAIFYAGAAKALAEVDSSMTDEQKALTIHDYLCSEGIYPDLTGGSQPIHHTAYGFFYNRVVVCQGFALAYIYLLQQLGIECTYVASDAMNHAWNLVKINGSWYNVDVTWDNFDIQNGATVYDLNAYGSMKHIHFLKSDSYFTNSLDHTGGTTYGNLTATSTAYDGAFWDALPCSRIFVVNGDYYYLAPNNGRYGILYLTKRTPAGTETKLGAYVTTSTLSYSAFTESLARLAWLDNRFYIAANYTLYAKLLDGTQYTVASTDGNFCVGLGVNENHNLFWQAYSDLTTLNELDKLTYYETYMTAQKQNGAAVNYNNYPDINLDGAVNAKDYALIMQK